MTDYLGSSKPLIVRTMRECCLVAVEAHTKDRGSEAEGTVVQCEKYPKNSDHRVTVRGGKWIGKVVPPKIS